MQNRSLTILFAGLHIGRGDFAPHHHKVWELVYVSRGAVITWQGDHAYHLSAGMILVNPPLVDHWDSFIRPYELIYLFVDGSLLDRCERVFSDDSEGTMGRAFEAILREWSSPKADRDEMLGALAAQLEILIRRSQDAPEQEREPYLVEAERLLRNSVGHPMTLDEVAAQVGVSRSWLHQGFRKVYHQSPHDYVAGLRLEKALALLRHSSQKIAFIAEECGYSSGSHLTNHVRKVTGFNPSEIRNAIRKAGHSEVA